MPDDEEWMDETAGRMGRMYAVTGGRVSPTRTKLEITTQFKRVADDLDLAALEPEQRDIAALCGRWLSVAEIAAFQKLPLAVTRVLLGDLLDHGVVMMSETTRTTSGPTRAQLVKVLDHLKAM